MRTPKARSATLSSHPATAEVAITPFAVALLAVLTPPMTFNDGVRDVVALRVGWPTRTTEYDNATHRNGPRAAFGERIDDLVAQGTSARRSSSAATTSTRARSRLLSGRPRPCATEATQSPIGPC